MKAEWTSVLGSRAFLDVLVGNWWNFFPLRPVRDFDLYDGPWGPGRVNTGHQPDLRRRRQQRLPGPEALEAAGLRQPVVLQGRLDGQPRLQGRLRPEARPPQPLPRSAVRHLLPRQRRRPLSQVDIYNTAVTGINDVVNQAVWVNDTWKLTNRLTLNLGLRYEHYLDHWPEQEFAPNGIPALAGFNDTRYQDVHRAAHSRGPHRGQHQGLLAARRLRLRPDRRQPHGAQGLLRPDPLELGRRAGRQGKPGRHRAAALRVPRLHRHAHHAVRPERQSAARQPGRARRVQHHRGRRRLRHASTAT